MDLDHDYTETSFVTKTQTIPALGKVAD